MEIDGSALNVAWNFAVDAVVPLALIVAVWIIRGLQSHDGRGPLGSRDRNPASGLRSAVEERRRLMLSGAPASIRSYCRPSIERRIRIADAKTEVS